MIVEEVKHMRVSGLFYDTCCTRMYVRFKPEMHVYMYVQLQLDA